MKKSRKIIKKNKRNSLKFKLVGGIKLNVESHLQGLNVTLDVEPTDTIQSIKSKVIAQIGAQPNNFYKLTYNDVQLSDRQTIAHYGIPDNSKLMFRRHTPGFKITEEERAEEHKKHKFGICGSCDNPLDDRADWVSDPGVGLMCNACNAYYTEGETDGYVDASNGDDRFDIQHFCNSTMWSKDLKVGDRVITCGESIYSSSDKHPVPLGIIGTIVHIGYRFKDTAHQEIRYKVKFDDYPHILEDMEHLYWCHNLRPV